jgi:hypothetical protein
MCCRGLNHCQAVIGASLVRRGASRPIVLGLARSCEKKEPAFSEGATELCGRHARNAPKNFAEGAWARVADFKRKLDEAAGGFADELLCAGDPLSGHELQRRHSRCLLKHTRLPRRIISDQLLQARDAESVRFIDDDQPCRIVDCFPRTSVPMADFGISRSEFRNSLDQSCVAKASSTCASSRTRIASSSLSSARRNGSSARLWSWLRHLARSASGLQLEHSRAIS